MISWGLHREGGSKNPNRSWDCRIRTQKVWDEPNWILTKTQKHKSVLDPEQIGVLLVCSGGKRRKITPKLTPSEVAEEEKRQRFYGPAEAQQKGSELCGLNGKKQTLPPFWAFGFLGVHEKARERNGSKNQINGKQV